jgi:hypothetical protein
MTPQFVARAQAFGKAVAQVQLLDMLDPKHRDTDWVWSEFPAHAAKWAAACSWLAFPEAEWKLWEGEIRDVAGRAAESEVLSIFEESKLLEWMPAKKKFVGGYDERRAENALARARRLREAP